MTKTKCQRDGCTSLDVNEYEHPSGGEGDNPAVEYLCDRHAQEFGYCLGCRLFQAGFESYDFSEVPGYCYECVQEMKIEAGEYDDDFEDEYDDEDY